MNKMRWPYPSACAARNFHGTMLRCDRNFLVALTRSAFVYATKKLRVGFRYLPVKETTRGSPSRDRSKLEHESGIEPLMAVLQTANLPLVDSCNLGALGRSRTDNPFRAGGFKSPAYAIPPHAQTCYHLKNHAHNRRSHRSRG